MEENEILDELDILGFQPLAFDVDTFVQSIRPSIDSQTVKNVLYNNPRFIRLSGSTDMFILDSSLFQWFSNLNIRLARSNEFKLSKSQLANIMNDLRLYGRWDTIPLEAVRWAESLGLIRSSQVESIYVFPLAKVLSCLPLDFLLVVADILENIAWERNWKLIPNTSIGSLEELEHKVWEECIACPEFSDCGEINLVRELFLREGKINPEKLKWKFWNKIFPKDKRLQLFYLNVLVRHIINKQGSIIIKMDLETTGVIRFMEQCPYLLCFELSKSGLSIIGLNHFTVAELLDFTEQGINYEHLKDALLSDAQFVSLGSNVDGNGVFLLHSFFLEFLMDLNIKLAELWQFQLSELQFIEMLKQFIPSVQINSLSFNLTKSGELLKFISPYLTKSGYAFPMARIISYLPQSSLSGIPDILKESLFFHRNSQDFYLHTYIENLLEKFRVALSKFDERIAYVIKAREGFFSGKKMTLEEIANSLNLTRERVRQLEMKFWNQNKQPELSLISYAIKARERFLSGKEMRKSSLKVTRKHASKLVEAKNNKKVERFLVETLLQHIMEEKGSLLVKTSSPKLSIIKFVAECLEVPYVELEQIGMIVLCASPKDFKLLKSRKLFLENRDVDTVINRLESETKLALVNTDIKILAENIVQFLREHLSIAQRVYVALSSIGHPAHYTKVTDRHNTLFPNNISSEHYINVVLSKKEYDIVWIGINGVYALKEWGFKSPKKTLFDTVTDIVKTIYERTGKPVPFSVITAEIGKYRKVVNISSLKIATSCNPRLQRISGDLFIPKRKGSIAKRTKKLSNDISAEKLDKILQEFKQEN